MFFDVAVSVSNFYKITKKFLPPSVAFPVCGVEVRYGYSAKNKGTGTV